MLRGIEDKINSMLSYCLDIEHRVCQKGGASKLRNDYNRLEIEWKIFDHREEIMMLQNNATLRSRF